MLTVLGWQSLSKSTASSRAAKESTQSRTEKAAQESLGKNNAVGEEDTNEMERKPRRAGLC